MSELQNYRSFQFLSLSGVLGSALWSLLGGPGLSWFSMDPSGRSLVAGSLAPFGSVTGDLLVGSSWLGPWGHLVGWGALGCAWPLAAAVLGLGFSLALGSLFGPFCLGPLSWALGALMLSRCSRPGPCGSSWLGPWGHLVGPSAGDGVGEVLGRAWPLAAAALGGGLGGPLWVLGSAVVLLCTVHSFYFFP